MEGERREDKKNGRKNKKNKEKRKKCINKNSINWF